MKNISLPTLYARTNTGAIQQWTIFVKDNCYQTSFGQIDGKIQTTKWTECFGTNIGKANERSAVQQAAFEAKALWKKKKDSGYYENINDIDSQSFIEPMLAKNFDDYKQDISFPIYSQPKLDGIRCIVTKKGMYSRNGKEIVSCPHIRSTLQYIFDKDPDIVLDGELYCDKLNNDFNKICSLVKKTKPTKDEIAESSTTIQYWIYDIVKGINFFERGSWINLNVKPDSCIRKVPTAVCNNLKELDRYYEEYLKIGYEGQMIRTNSIYENKRSKTLLKRKEFQDKEYTILDVIEGEGNKAGMAGAMVFKNEAGISFNSNIKGNREYLKEILLNKKEYIGKQATVKYFNLTPDNNIPRFPYVVGVRDYE
jgi:DNA ligase-1